MSCLWQRLWPRQLQFQSRHFVKEVRALEALYLNTFCLPNFSTSNFKPPVLFNFLNSRSQHLPLGPKNQQPTEARHLHRLFSISSPIKLDLKLPFCLVSPSHKMDSMEKALRGQDDDQGDNRGNDIMPASTRDCFHLDKGVCDFIKSTITSMLSLDIKASWVAAPGSGLFFTGEEPIPEGRELFRSRPMVTCVDNKKTTVCHYCFINTATFIHPSGRLRSTVHEFPKASACAGCKVARFCSEVSFPSASNFCRVQKLTCFPEMPPQGVEDVP